MRERLEYHLLDKCIVLTTGQRCADWFVLRQFRVTATEATKVYANNNDVRELLGYRRKETTEATDEELFAWLSRSWFSNARATEAMKRGTVNEDALLRALKQKYYIIDLFPVGLVARKKYPWLAASPDAVCGLDMTLLNEEFREDRECICVVEMKTIISSDSLNRVAELATPDLIVCEFGSEVFTDYIPEDHAGQMLHQVITTRIANAIYISASESQINYIVLAICPRFVSKDAQNYIVERTSPFMEWTVQSLHFLPNVVREEDRELFWSRLDFWSVLNTHMKENGPLLPIRVFRHSVQTMYSKTRGGVDGSSQYRATLRCSTISPKWEQKLVTHVLKSITANASVAWRMFKKESLLETKRSFQSLDYFRRRLNEVQSLADFTHDVVLELLEFLAQITESEDTEAGNEIQELSQNDITRLRAMARSRKRKRVEFFNSEEMSKLRLHVKTHQHVYAEKELYCALCGQNRTASFREHHTVIKCLFCDTHLCVKVHPGFRKSCFDVWHSAKKIVPRKPFPFSAPIEDEEDPKDEEQEVELPEKEETQERGRRRGKRRRMITQPENPSE